tara:strand:+ start:1318 stop:2442 length:1125 start_codon:yes stop_codon:yes gene_type:complete
MVNSVIEKIIKDKICQDDFLDLEKFLKIILYEKKYGFYNQINNFQKKLIGKNGHFVTAPEISQIFGELIAIWLIDYFYKSNSSCINLIELGPGNGTLMHDILRVINQQKNINLKINLYFLETSSKLKQIQHENIDHYKYKKYWYKKLSVLKKNLTNSPTIFLANEFFDCLPISQYKFFEHENEWKKKCLKIQGNKFYFDHIEINNIDEELIKKINSNSTTNIKEKKFIEYSPMATEIMLQIVDIIDDLDGCALFIDYGKSHPFGNTLQAVYKNKKVPLLKEIGNCDYSSLVDFSNMKNIATSKGLKVYPLISQREFLLRLGIKERAENLAKNATNLQKRNILSEVERLISKIHMGEIFKVFCITKNSHNVIGFI